MKFKQMSDFKAIRQEIVQKTIEYYQAKFTSSNFISGKSRVNYAGRVFDEKELVYVGEGWNCFLRVAEHTRKDSDKLFTKWNFIEITDENERKQVERELRSKFKPKYNRG